MKQIAIFASGNGTNAQELIKHFNSQNNGSARVSLIISNNKQAGVLAIAASNYIKTLVIDRESFYETFDIVHFLKENQIDIIVLAGFLWLIPENLIQHYRGKIINIHPALLPKYGGKGMHGKNVHRAVKESLDDETGITIHLVNEKYDEGKILFQAKCKVDAKDSVEDIEQKVHHLEHLYYAKTIEKVVLSELSLKL